MGEYDHLITAIRTGTKQDADAAFAELSKAFAPLINASIKRFSIPHNTRDDLRNEMLFLLWEATKTYDPEKGTLAGYVATIFAHRLCGLLTSARGIRRGGQSISLSLDQHRADGDHIGSRDGYGDGGSVSFVDLLTTADHIPEVSIDAFVSDAIATCGFSHIEATVFTYFCRNAAGDPQHPDYADIAENTGLTGKQIDNAVLRFRRKISQHLPVSFDFADGELPTFKKEKQPKDIKGLATMAILYS